MTDMLSEKQKNIILSIAEHDMRTSAVTREMSKHRNSILYHIGRIWEITGKDPLNFYDLHDLVAAVKQERRKNG
jgi:sugar diacid utilization regulator